MMRWHHICEPPWISILGCWSSFDSNRFAEIAVRLVDVNLLIYAVNRDAPQHTVAKAWLEQRLNYVELVVPGERHWPILRALLAESGTAGNLTTDAHLAALAIESGAELESADADFARFRGLRWSNPLIS